MISPCIKVCKINPANNLCLGCGRTIKEISDWANLKINEKENILLNLKNRLVTEKQFK